VWQQISLFVFLSLKFGFFHSQSSIFLMASSITCVSLDEGDLKISRESNERVPSLLETLYKVVELACKEVGLGNGGAYSLHEVGHEVEVYYVSAMLEYLLAYTWDQQ